MRNLILFVLLLGVAYLTVGVRWDLKHKLHWLQTFHKDAIHMSSLHIDAVEKTAIGANAIERERFLLDILLQVHKPLMNGDFMTWAKNVHTDRNMYKKPHDEWLMWFLSHAKTHDFTGRQNRFSSVNFTHAQQIMGFYKFLVLARDWETFVHNVCFGRMYLNPVLFVSGLYSAVRDRDDTDGMIMPAMHEVLPAMFFDDVVIKMAEEVDWSHLINRTQTRKPMWWDVIGIRERLRGGVMYSHPKQQMNLWNPWLWWSSHKLSHMPHSSMTSTESQMDEDETLVLNIDNGKHPMQISDDVGMNVFWHHILIERLMHKMMTLTPIVNSTGKWSSMPTTSYMHEMNSMPMMNTADKVMNSTMMNNSAVVEHQTPYQWPVWQFKQKDDSLMRRTVGMTTSELRNARSGEIFMHTIQQIMARVYFDRIALMSMRSGDQSWWWWQQQSHQAVSVFRTAVQQATYEFKRMVDETLEEHQIDWHSHEYVMNTIGDLLMGRNTKYPHAWEMMYTTVGGISATHSTIVNLHELLMEELVQLFAYYEHKLSANSGAADWQMPTVHIHRAIFDPFITYTEAHDSVLINMIDQQLLQTDNNNMAYVKQSVVARQQRLNHYPFNMIFEITSERTEHVVVRVLMAPKIDINGQSILLMENRQNFIVFDIFEHMLQPGRNVVRRHSHSISWTTRDFTPLTELYKQLFTKDVWHHEEFVGCNCRFPHRLLLPRGTSAGLPVQMFVVVTAIDTEISDRYINMEHTCGGMGGISSIQYDRLPFNFPYHRAFTSMKYFDVPNVFMWDTAIYHHDETLLY